MTMPLRQLEALDPQSSARIEDKRRGNQLGLIAFEDWIVSGLAGLDARLRSLAEEAFGIVEWDLAPIEKMDTVGAWLVRRTVRELEARGARVRLTGLDPKHALLL